jgi:glucokinase
VKSICGDIGGTHDDLAVVEDGEILFHQQRESRSQHSFIDYLKQFIKQADGRGLEAGRACFAAAGPVKDGAVELTHTDLRVDRRQIASSTDLSEVKVVNDFTAFTDATQVVDESQLKHLQKGEERRVDNVSVIGAGTGLGKGILVGAGKGHRHVESEGGHAAAPVRPCDGELHSFLRDRTGRAPVQEDFLSGRGLKNIHDFLRQTSFSDAEELSPEQISERKDKQDSCREAFDVFVSVYADLAQAFALETNPGKGLYIGGGVAARNPDEFGDRFVERFVDAPESRFEELLRGMPVRLVTDYKVSLLGAERVLETH